MSEEARGRKGKGRATDSDEPADRVRASSVASVTTAFQRSESTSSVLRLPAGSFAAGSRRPRPANVVVHRPSDGGPLSPTSSQVLISLSPTHVRGQLSSASSSGGAKDPATGEPLPRFIINNRERKRSPPLESKAKDLAKQIGSMRAFFDRHDFKLTIDEEVDAFEFCHYSNTDLRYLLVHAVNAVQSAIKAHKKLLKDAGVAKDVIDTVDVDYFDLDDLSERVDVISYSFLEGEKVDRFDVDETTLPTIAMLGIFKTTITEFSPKPKFMEDARRQQILRNWVDSPERNTVPGLHPVKLYQSHFTRKDINYAACYAKERYNKAHETYTGVWEDCEQLIVRLGLKDVTVEDWGCPHPDQLVKNQLRPKNLVDFNKIDDAILMAFDWKPAEPKAALSSKYLETQEQKRRNFRYSIAVFARNVIFMTSWTLDLLTVYDDYQLSSPESE